MLNVYQHDRESNGNTEKKQKNSANLVHHTLAMHHSSRTNEDTIGYTHSLSCISCCAKWLVCTTCMERQSKCHRMKAHIVSLLNQSKLLLLPSMVKNKE